MREAQRFFEDKAAAYRGSKSHGNVEDLARMVACLRPKRGALALDVATGGGHTARALAEAGCRVVATDATRGMLSGLPVGEAVLSDALAMPFRDARFDVVACRIAAHHFFGPEIFCAEAARVLKPGGALYVFDLTSPEDAAQAEVVNHIERLRDPSHGWSFEPSRWRAAVDTAGLALETLETRTSAFDLAPWIERAQMLPERERALRTVLDARPDLGGYGLDDTGKMRVLRVELLARKT